MVWSLAYLEPKIGINNKVTRNLRVWVKTFVTFVTQFSIFEFIELFFIIILWIRLRFTVYASPYYTNIKMFVVFQGSKYKYWNFQMSQDELEFVSQCFCDLPDSPGARCLKQLDAIRWCFFLLKEAPVNCKSWLYET